MVCKPIPLRPFWWFHYIAKWYWATTEKVVVISYFKFHKFIIYFKLLFISITRGIHPLLVSLAQPRWWLRPFTTAYTDSYSCYSFYFVTQLLYIPKNFNLNQINTFRINLLIKKGSTYYSWRFRRYWRGIKFYKIIDPRLKN